jgi:hypothetical protein
MAPRATGAAAAAAGLPAQASRAVALLLAAASCLSAAGGHMHGHIAGAGDAAAAAGGVSARIGLPAMAVGDELVYTLDLDMGGDSSAAVSEAHRMLTRPARPVSSAATLRVVPPA